MRAPAVVDTSVDQARVKLRAASIGAGTDGGVGVRVGKPTVVEHEEYAALLRAVRAAERERLRASASRVACLPSLPLPTELQ
jgi:hypothetical protein